MPIDMDRLEIATIMSLCALSAIQCTVTVNLIGEDRIQKIVSLKEKAWPFCYGEPDTMPC